MKIGFHAGTMNYRGVHIAIFDYALHNQSILGNESVIFFDGSNPGPQPIVDKFKSYFEMVPYQKFSNVDKLCDLHKVDGLYIQKAGKRDSEFVTSVPNLIHAVFPQKVSEQHGEVYAFISQWLSKECSNSKIPFVDYMVLFPEATGDLRERLGIPANATVLGCYGGEDSFNIPFVQDAVRELAKTNSNLYFLFMNMDAFAIDDHIIFLPGTPDMEFKRLFIQSCDAMLHARGMGESFGLACAEFSISNKPIITYGLSHQRNHIDILGDKAFIYSNKSQLKEIINNLDRTWIKNQDWDCYSQAFSAQNIMQQFQDVFLAPISSGSFGLTPISFLDHGHIYASKLKKKVRGFKAKYQS